MKNKNSYILFIVFLVLFLLNTTLIIDSYTTYKSFSWFFIGSDIIFLIAFLIHLRDVMKEI